MKNQFKNVVLTALTYTLWAIFVPPFLLLCTLIACLPQAYRQDNQWYFFLTSTMSWLILKSSFLKIRYVGKNNLTDYLKSSSIIIANHSSILDVALLEVLTKSYPRVWMSKDTYVKVPFGGFLLKRMHVLVNKTSITSAHRALIALQNKVKDAHRHALIFPEGTRHSDGNVHHFYSGFAILAQRLGRPVIPIVISGMHTVMPKKSFIIDSCDSNVTITIGKPMYCPVGADIEQFTKSIERHFEHHLKTMDA